MNDFTQRRIEIAAISVDSTTDSRKLSQAKGYTFPVLSDPNAEVIKRYGLLHPKGAEDGHDIARPAEILIDANGTVRWENLTDDLRVRARPGQVLEAFDSLLASNSYQFWARRTKVLTPTPDAPFAI